VRAATKNEQVPLRCVRRRSVHLNRGKASELAALISAYAREKDDHLRALTPTVFASTPNDRAYRDQLVACNYKSPHGLQARMWKMAVNHPALTGGACGTFPQAQVDQGARSKGGAGTEQKRFRQAKITSRCFSSPEH
jgi:hypothetical protein